LNSAIPLVLRVMSRVLTFIGNIDLASLDQNQEADGCLISSALDGEK
jgi:hypothetical protein